MLPGVCFWCRTAWTRENRIEFIECLLRQLYIEGVQVPIELFFCAWTNDGSGDRLLCQQPGQPDMSWILSQFGAEALVCFQLWTVLLDFLLDTWLRTASLLCLF